MSKEYIERGALCKACGESITKCNLCIAKEIPADDVVEVGHLREMLSELESRHCGDCPETYTSGYQNGHRNGQIELLRYILQIPDGTSESEDGR